MQSSRSEPVWLDPAFATLLNEMQVAETGEPHHLRDPGLLSSAMAAPGNLYFYEGERSILVLGVRLMLKIAQNHPFAQGNKRTAFIAGVAFIEQNGFFVELPNMENVADKFVAMITGDLTESEFLKFIRPYVLSATDAKKFWK